MKKIFLAIYLLLIFSTTTANAYTAFVGIDDTFTSVVGFYFDVSFDDPNVIQDQLSLTIYYQGDTVVVCGEDIGGAVPGTYLNPWYVGSLSSNPANAYWGFDAAFVFLEDNLTPLSPGIILSLEAGTDFSLDNFILAGVNSDGLLYLYDLNIIETSMESCREGDMYTLSAVPIPGSLVLLGSGLIGLIGLGRRRMRK